MAGMLYLPRLFVYHCESEAGSKQSETFKVMERRLLKAIINPAMIVTWLAGIYLALVPQQRHARMVGASITWNYTKRLISPCLSHALLVWRLPRIGGKCRA